MDIIDYLLYTLLCVHACMSRIVLGLDPNGRMDPIDDDLSHPFNDTKCPWYGWKAAGVHIKMVSDRRQHSAGIYGIDDDDNDVGSHLGS